MRLKRLSGSEFASVDPVRYGRSLSGTVLRALRALQWQESIRGWAPEQRRTSKCGSPMSVAKCGELIRSGNGGEDSPRPERAFALNNLENGGSKFIMSDAM